MYDDRDFAVLLWFMAAVYSKMFSWLVLWFIVVRLHVTNICPQYTDLIKIYEHIHYDPSWSIKQLWLQPIRTLLSYPLLSASELQDQAGELDGVQTTMLRKNTEKNFV